MTRCSALQKDPYHSEKDTLRWHEASFQVIQVLLKRNRSYAYYYTFDDWLLSTNHKLFNSGGLSANETKI